MKKSLYKWHRVLSLIISIPMVLWAASGFMHPVMTNIRPAVTTQWLQPVEVDSSKIIVPLEVALQQNRIDTFSRFRLVHIDTIWFYQVQVSRDKAPLYISTLNGHVLTAGDWLYAQYLAKQFLEGQDKEKRSSGKVADMPAGMSMVGGHDCCDAATVEVLHPVKGSKVKAVSRLTEFDGEYKSINRLLPAYRVAFDRADGIRVYVETGQDRFAFAMDNKRYGFDRFFTLVHLWGWLYFLGKGKLLVEFLFAVCAFVTSVMGLYLFFATKSKKVKGNSLVKARRNHRYSAVAISLFTLMFSFSGAFHVLSKLREDTRRQYFVDSRWVSRDIHFNLLSLRAVVKEPILNIGLVNIWDTAYWQVNIKANNGGQPTDLMKSSKVAAPLVMYIRVNDLKVLQEGEIQYAKYLATRFSRHMESRILSVAVLTKFTNEYNFTDKRLPVWKVKYADSSGERYYVETSTGQLSKKINDRDLMEGYSFAFFHKHEFMAWGGKGLKDFSTMFWAMAQIVVVGIGLWFYFKWRSR